MYIEPWIGVDLDKTLAYYDEWRGPLYIGEPIPEMLERVKTWLASGIRVKIFTARIGAQVESVKEYELIHKAIRAWCWRHLGRELEITCCKDVGMTELWDDVAVPVVPNTGRMVGIDEQEPTHREGPSMEDEGRSPSEQKTSA